MSVAVITGSAGLIGSEASAFFAGMGLDVVGIDNDMRKTFFGEEASTSWNREPSGSAAWSALSTPVTGHPGQRCDRSTVRRPRQRREADRAYGSAAVP